MIKWLVSKPHSCQKISTTSWEAEARARSIGQFPRCHQQVISMLAARHKQLTQTLVATSAAASAQQPEMGSQEHSICCTDQHWLWYRGSTGRYASI